MRETKKEMEKEKVRERERAKEKERERERREREREREKERERKGERERKRERERKEIEGEGGERDSLSLRHGGAREGEHKKGARRRGRYLIIASHGENVVESSPRKPPQLCSHHLLKLLAVEF